MGYLVAFVWFLVSFVALCTLFRLRGVLRYTLLVLVCLSMYLFLWFGHLIV